jgi:phosphatidylinositol kinase/protein kinase (PI-3  family)
MMGFIQTILCIKFSTNWPKFPLLSSLKDEIDQLIQKAFQDYSHICSWYLMIDRSQDYQLNSQFQSIDKYSSQIELYQEIQIYFSKICLPETDPNNHIHRLQSIINYKAKLNIVALLPLTSTLKAIPGNPKMPIICSLRNQSSKVQFLQLPTLIKITSGIGVDYKYIYKQYEDARKDIHVMNFVSIINQIFSKDRSSKQRNLFLTTYLKIYLDQKKAMIERVEYTIEFSWAIEKTKIRTNSSSPKNNSNVSKFLDRKQHQSMKSQKRFEIFVKELLPQYSSVLHLYYAHKFTESSKWYQAKTMFTCSVACWSIIGYILGLGDRHAKNVLLNKKTGACMHIDFAVLFNK